MATNAFKPRKFEDFTIVGKKGDTVGHIRVKPSGVLWASKNAKVWLGVSLAEFDAFMTDRGKRQKK
jgi:hypothetical protein